MYAEWRRDHLECASQRDLAVTVGGQDTPAGAPETCQRVRCMKDKSLFSYTAGASKHRPDPEVGVHCRERWQDSKTARDIARQRVDIGVIVVVFGWRWVAGETPPALGVSDYPYIPRYRANTCRYVRVICGFPAERYGRVWSW